MAEPSAGDPVDDPSIGGDEFVLRRVHPDLAKTGKPESSIFKDDPGGIGTSVTLWRSADDLAIVTAGRAHVGVVAVTVAELRAEGLGLMFTFEEGNPNHCEVFGPRTKRKMRTLREQARWVRYPDPFPDQAKGEEFQLYPSS
ncbi:MAG: hypothetical protein K2P68_09420 [Sphingomonas sp.]|nr:hypothetical protein [Sphingomonas sp.]